MFNVQPLPTTNDMTQRQGRRRDDKEKDRMAGDNGSQTGREKGPKRRWTRRLGLGECSSLYLHIFFN
jgi:hypothetical protein